MNVVLFVGPDEAALAVHHEAGSPTCTTVRRDVDVVITRVLLT